VAFLVNGIFVSLVHGIMARVNIERQRDGNTLKVLQSLERVQIERIKYNNFW
jgi:hypothetical protein